MGLTSAMSNLLFVLVLDNFISSPSAVKKKKEEKMKCKKERQRNISHYFLTPN